MVPEVFDDLMQVTPETASESESGQRAILRCMSVGTVDAQLSKSKRGKSVVTVPFLTASLWG